MERGRLGDLLLVVTGIGLAAVTFQHYRYFSSTTGPARQEPISSLQADAQIQSMKSYLSTNSSDFRAWTDLAISCYQKGPDAYIDGLNALDRARRLGATGEQLFYYAGVMYQGVGLPDYAAPELEKYLRHFPGERDSRVRLANIYLQQKRLDESWGLYQELKNETPRDPVVLFNMAVVAKEKNVLNEAEKLIQELKNATSTLPPALPALEAEIAKKRGGKK